jgi:hypothetical protein
LPLLPIPRFPSRADLIRSLFALALVQPPAGTITGTVVDAQGGAGLRRVSVRLQTDGRTVATDDEGRFEIRDVAPGRHELYVSAVDFMLVKRNVTVAAGETADITIPITEGTGTYTETVIVRGSAAATRTQPEVAAEQTLGSFDLQQLRGLLTNDPMRAIQVLPGVATGDDFRSEFSVRGAGVTQMNFTFEGVSTPFLVHTVQQVRETGSVAMVNGDVLDEVSLLSGAYPERFGNRLGAELDFRMREGTRDHVQSHVSVSATDAAAVVEGPLGGSGRGSWLASARKSYLDLVLKRIYPTQGVGFGFEDVQAKFVYDVTPRHQIQFAITGGQSELDRDPGPLGAGDVQIGDNASAVGVLTWRYLPSATFALHQRVAVTVNDFRNTTKDAAELDHGRSRDLLYRADWMYAPRTAVTFEGGGEARASAMALLDQRLSGGAFQIREGFDESATSASAYVQARLRLPGGGSLVPGARLDHWSLSGHTAASPWIATSWPLSSSLTLRAGGGLYRQEPGFLETRGLHGTPSLDGQRAWDVDAGLEGRVGSASRWQVTLYDREDRGVFRLPNAEGRVINGVYVPGSLTTRYVNALDGHARGVEALVQHRAPNGLSGWAAYSYGVNRYTDRTSAESFWGDFDQRHAVNVYGTYRFSDRVSASARFRAGSNFPATGYYREQDGVDYATSARNELRVPYYARLDARLNRTFTWERKRLTLFLEGLNVLDRENVRVGIPSVNRRTLAATNLFDTMVPIVPSIGLLLEF